MYLVVKISSCCRTNKSNLKLQAAVREILPDADVSAVLVRPCPDPKFGDYQSNALMSLAKARKMNPRQLADRCSGEAGRFRRLRKSGNRRRGLPEFPAEKFRRSRKRSKPPRAANICFLTKLRSRKPSSLISVRRTSPSRCTSATSAPRFSATRCAHAAAARPSRRHRQPHRRLGHAVRNAACRLETELDSAALEQRCRSARLERLYKKISAECNSKNPATLEAARAGIGETSSWRRGKFENLARNDCALAKTIRRNLFAARREIRSRARRKFLQSVTRNRSWTNCSPKNIARESEGAIAIFFDDNPQLKEHPALIRKSDGGFNYTTTDLATLALSAGNLAAGRNHLCHRRTPAICISSNFSPRFANGTRHSALAA